MADIPPPPSKTHMDACADQHLAAARELRAALGDGDRLVSLADGLAVILREQFPSQRQLGRIALAVASAMESIHSAAQGRGRPLSRLELVAVAALAAEALEREEAARG